jgi:hypothetical protein
MALTKKQKAILDKYKDKGDQASGGVKNFFSKIKNVGKQAASEAKELGVGVAKGAGEFATGAAELYSKAKAPIEKFQQAGQRVLLPKQLEEKFGVSKGTPTVSETFLKQAGELKDKGTFEAKTPGQARGKFAFDVGSFVVPGGQATKVAKAPKIAAKFGKFAQPLTQGVAAFGTELTRTGGDTKGAGVTGALTGALTGAIPVVGKGFKAVSSKFTKPKSYSGLLSYARKLGEKSGVPKASINMLAKASAPEKALFNKLVSKAAQRVQQPTAEHPVVEIGKLLLKDVDSLAKNAKTTGQKLGGLKSKLISTPKALDVSSVKNSLTRQLKLAGAKIDDIKGSISFPSSYNKTEQKLVEDAFKQLSGMKNTAQAINFIDDFAKRLDVVKTSGKVSSQTPVEAMLSTVRTKLANKVGSADAGYKELSKKYATSKSALDLLKKRLGMSQYADEEVIGIKAGELARQLINRNTSRPTEMVGSLYKALKQYDPKINPQQKLQSFKKQVNLTDLLEDLYKIEPVSSFKGAVESATTQAITGTPKTLTGTVDAAIGKGLDLTLRKVGLTAEKAEVAKKAIETALKLVPKAEQAQKANQLLQVLVGPAAFAGASLPGSGSKPDEFQLPSTFTPIQADLKTTIQAPEGFEPIQVPSTFTPL